jgi:hypothetical protein
VFKLEFSILGGKFSAEFKRPSKPHMDTPIPSKPDNSSSAPANPSTPSHQSDEEKFAVMEEYDRQFDQSLKNIDDDSADLSRRIKEGLRFTM